MIRYPNLALPQDVLMTRPASRAGAAVRGREAMQRRNVTADIGHARHRLVERREALAPTSLGLRVSSGWSG